MSVIIRLQNLPLSAKSGDIRQFFGGLYIPDGGVHILGGEKGDAFIVFMSEEEAHLAMRKNGGKIKNFQIRLFRSNLMEMQYEVEKKTKCNFDDVSPYKMLSSIHTSDAEVNRSRSSEKKKLPGNRSPYGSDWRNDKSKPLNDYHEISRPVSEERIISSRESPKRRSRSPKRHLSSQRCPPSKSRTYSQRRISVSPKPSRYIHSEYELPEQSNSEFQSATQSQLQAELEKRITEELEKSHVFNMIFDKKPTEYSIPGLSIGASEDMSCGIQGLHTQNNSYKNVQEDLMSFLRSDTHQFQEHELKFNYLVDKGHEEKYSVRHSEMLRSNVEDIQQKYSENFYVTLQGLDPVWNFREVQMILKGIFAPQHHIRFGRDHSGYKTGIAFVKLTNKEDFDSIIKKRSILFNGFEIKVSVCPDSVSCNYFPSNSNSEKIPENNDFCYTLKGLPFSCSHDHVIHFFHGFEIADLVIFYDKKGKATGTGYVSFTNKRDFEEALSQNGKKIFHRYIEMLPCTQKEMDKAKKNNYEESSSFIPYSKILSDQKLPVTRSRLCALITGLPLDTTIKKINTFFSESGLKPDAIHLTVKKNRKSDGRAFVEFTNFLDFDLALKFHGKEFNSNIICVKQILYDEMMKILDSQKARHYFETNAPSGSSGLNVPEKVPYLWEPPDSTEELDEVQVENSSAHHKRESSNNYGANRLQDNLSHSSLSLEVSKPQFTSSKGIYGDKNFDSYSSTELESSVKSHNTGLNTEWETVHNIFTKVPLQTNIKNFFDANTKPNEPFTSPEKYEDNRSKSSEHEVAVLKFLNDIKERKSPDRRERRTYREKSPPKSKRDFRNDKLHKYADDSKYKRERDSRHYADWKLDHNSRGSSQSDRREKEDRSRGCVVHLSNVSVSVGTQDLLKFLKGFDFYENTLIRRYTDEGEPTRDVRVMFCSEREAREAIRRLNKCFLHNKPISLNIL